MGTFLILTKLTENKDDHKILPFDSSDGILQCIPMAPSLDNLPTAPKDKQFMTIISMRELIRRLIGIANSDMKIFCINQRILNNSLQLGAGPPGFEPGL